MRLLTKAIEAKLPKLYANDGKETNEQKVIVKYFNPAGSQTWYITEYDGSDIMYGYMTGSQVNEFGYVSLSELRSVKGSFGLGIERDLHWNDKTTIADILNKTNS